MSDVIQPAGVILVDKPVGPTSFRMVQQVRRALAIKKVGHAGTLDPFASGLLVICVGRSATRMISQLMEGDKEYLGILRLGQETDTLDRQGALVAEHEVPGLDDEQIERCLARFRGTQLQQPPQFSALKHKGKPLYHYARKGIVVEKEPRRITIFSLECLKYCQEYLHIRVVCSKGTYVRSLAADIGTALGCGAHLHELRRTRSGSFHVADALDGALLADQERARQLLTDRMLSVEEAMALVRELTDK
ncbi:MAG: tRNA pseudouridine(55) synthase TruB [Desulfobulbaceae bacterium]|nr:MAG: tRNA pseudouridine(55) synthase TruB [Desulfobulbaceae bacterium]